MTYDECVYPNKAVYECGDGFELSRETTRKCQIDGEWTNDAPECEPEEEEEDEDDYGSGINRCYIEREQKIDIMCMLYSLVDKPLICSKKRMQRLSRRFVYVNVSLVVSTGC